MFVYEKKVPIKICMWLVSEYWQILNVVTKNLCLSVAPQIFIFLLRFIVHSGRCSMQTILQRAKYEYISV